MKGLLGPSCLAAVLLVGCAATPPEEDPVQIKLNDVDTRLTRIERVAANQSMLELANQVEALRSDVRSMRNEVDQSNHALESLRKQQHDLYADLDQRLKSVEARGGLGIAGSAASAPSVPTSSATGAAGGMSGAGTSGDVADKVSYQAAFDLLKEGQYDRAIPAFQSFLTTYPNSQLADNAQYWLGEAYYVERAFPEALAAFQRVVDGYPLSRKRPDALLKIGFCDYELKQYPAAREVLTQVTAQFADTSAGHLAAQRLEKMAAEKH